MVFRAFRPEGMGVSVAVPQAGPEVLGARGAEEWGLGLGGPHRMSLAEWIRDRPVPAVSGEFRDPRFLQGSTERGGRSLVM